MYKLRPDGPTLIGRGLDAEVRLDDEGVSRPHAKVITVRNGDPTLKDLGSSNGTYVSGNRIQTHTLKDGDKIQVGSILILEFSYQDDLERTFQEQLFDRGLKDGTTGIYNKQYLLDRIDNALRSVKKLGGNQLAVIEPRDKDGKPPAAGKNLNSSSTQANPLVWP